MPSEESPKTPILAVRIYQGIHSAIVKYAYFCRYGSHRPNLIQDKDLGAAVYAFVDMKKALESLGYQAEAGRTSVLGPVSGYLHSKENSRGENQP